MTLLLISEGKSLCESDQLWGIW